ncbi:MAG: CDP-diacylglycerol--glycerol-3-phosphate 3-phosphatidyltransferase [Lachnospiraceae bacterium]|nr:CDP-diacylglycerol--glycerol-3-phosphate 3-phosphatidyltransferase [Lachnospiraceae bacterium]
MNLPNKLTILRVLLIPVFLLCLLNEYNILALIIFVIASLTDMLDGKIARKYNLVTNFGKFMDPLADKLLVSSALISFVGLGRMPIWIVVVIISREFIISGFRLVAADKGVVIAASMWGKVKTVTQMVMIIVLLCELQVGFAEVLEGILIYASLILTVVSLVDYIVKNIDVMKE